MYPHDRDDDMRGHFGEMSAAKLDAPFLRDGASPPFLGDEASPLKVLPEALLEPTLFTDEDRTRQRRWCSRACGWLPVFVDLSFERVRSRVAVAVLLLQVAFIVILQAYLPRLGFDSIDFCIIGADTLGLDIGMDVDEALRILNSFQGVWYSYFAISLVALQEWNSPLWLLPAVAMAWASFGVRARLDWSTCVELAKLPFSTDVLVYDDDGNVMNSNYTSIYVFYNVLGIVFTGIVAVELTRLSMPVVRQLWSSARGALLWGTVNDEKPADTGGDGTRCSHHDDDESATIKQNVLVRFYRKHLACVPLRHVVACLLSTVALVYFALTFVGLLNEMASFVSGLRQYFAEFDPNSGPPDDPEMFVLWGICFALKNGVSDATAQQLFGTAHDICTYAPYGFIAISALLVGFIVHSFIAVNKHHRMLVQRYDGHVGDLNDVHEFLAQLSTPQLRMFSFLQAGEYLLAHLLVHIAVASVTSVLITIIVTSFIIALGGFPALLTYLVLISRVWLWKFVTGSWPMLLAKVVVPLFAFIGFDVMGVIDPVRTTLLRAALCFVVVDGPLVLAPRILLNVDAIYSATVGSALGVVDGFTRIIVSVVWGLLRCVMLHEPVVPMAAVAFDKPFMAYGSMMRSAHVAQLQHAGGGFGFGGKVIQAAPPRKSAPPSAYEEETGGTTTTDASSSYESLYANTV